MAATFAITSHALHFFADAEEVAKQDVVFSFLFVEREFFLALHQIPLAHCSEYASCLEQSCGISHII